MSEPVYLLVIGKGWTEAGHQLSQKERDVLWTRVEAVEERARSKWVIICNARWANESIFDWGVIEYPDMESYQEKVKELEELDWWRYFSAKTILGTRMEGWEMAYRGS